MRVRACTDGRTDRQTNRMHKHFSTLLESVKKRDKEVYFSRNLIKIAKLKKKLKIWNGEKGSLIDRPFYYRMAKNKKQL